MNSGLDRGIDRGMVNSYACNQVCEYVFMYVCNPYLTRSMSMSTRINTSFYFFIFTRLGRMINV